MAKTLRVVRSRHHGGYMASLILDDENGVRSIWDQTFETEENMERRIKIKKEVFEKSLKVKAVDGD